LEEKKTVQISPHSTANSLLVYNSISKGLQFKIDQSGYSLEDVFAVSEDIFTIAENGELRLKPVIVKDKNSILQQSTVDRMHARIMLNDRASAYLELYSATGSEQLLMQAQITTYSGAIGSLALVGNMLAKDMGGESYNVSLDQFSLEILVGTKDVATEYVGRQVSLLTDNVLQDADQAVWASKGMGHLFPGNIQFADYLRHADPEKAKSIFYSQGSINSLQMGTEFTMPFSDVAGIGNRPADFAGRPGYSIVDDGGRFISVVNDRAGSVELFWDKNIWLNPAEDPTPFHTAMGKIVGREFKQIENEPRHSDWDSYMTGNAVRQYLQADNLYIHKFNSNYTFENYGNVNSYLTDLRAEIRDEDYVPYVGQ
jgi:hypothetical protein